MSVRTRFAPSPTGFLHLGGARTALFAWAFARRHAGRFILRIEDTDLERSTPEAVQAILDGMAWLGLDYDEGPIHQMQRMDRYREVIAGMLASGNAYRCYMSPAELDALRAEQMARGEKPRYDGRWRDSTATPPAGVAPVIRFRNPLHGSVIWEDRVKGRIEIANEELDDLVIARADGTPTYNFCVVVDDLDMRISHVIRGDDHVNNTPRQINIIRALRGEVPVYAHVPTVLGEDGQKLSKRHGAVGVTEYATQGYLPEAMVNFLARLGWAHKDDEVFTREQLVEWFDLTDINPAPARFNLDKLLWLNQEHIKRASAERLGSLLTPFLEAEGCDPQRGPAPTAVAHLLRDRSTTLAAMAAAASYFYRRPEVPEALATQHLTDANRPAIAEIATGLRTVEWQRERISELIKSVAVRYGLKMPQVMMPLRVLVAGTVATPSVDAVLALVGRDEVEARLRAALTAAG
jgi:glutamyl-tRNA synthetase